MTYLHLQSDTPEDAGPGIRVATMHRVKGLEFTHMIIAGVQEGTVPLTAYTHQMDEAELEEHERQERCLLHVASTRARRNLLISGYGKPSRLIERTETKFL